MQKLYTFFSLFLMLCVLSSASCEKDNDDPAPEETPEQLILGKWNQNGGINIGYYDAQEIKLHEKKEPATIGILEFNEKQVTYLTLSTNPFKQDYTIDTSLGKIMYKENGRNYPVEITKLTKTEMSWVMEENKSSPYTIGGVTKQAHHVKLTFDFVKQP